MPQVIAAGTVVAVLTMLGSAPVSAASGRHVGHPGPAGLLPSIRGTHGGANQPADHGADGGESDEIMDSSEQFAAIRVAPGVSVSADAFTAAQKQARKLSRFGGRWQEVTDQPYNSDALNYRDPTWSNSSGGSGLVSGRMTALAADGQTIYAGGAAGDQPGRPFGLGGHRRGEHQR
jgi:hypothetical protein